MCVQCLKVVVVHFRLYFIVVTTLSPKMDLPLFEFAFCLLSVSVCCLELWRLETLQ